MQAAVTAAEPRLVSNRKGEQLWQSQGAHHFVGQDAAVHAGRTQPLGGLIQESHTLHLCMVGQAGVRAQTARGSRHTV